MRWNDCSQNYLRPNNLRQNGIRQNDFLQGNFNIGVEEICWWMRQNETKFGLGWKVELKKSFKLYCQISVRP